MNHGTVGAKTRLALKPCKSSIIHFVVLFSEEHFQGYLNFLWNHRDGNAIVTANY